jgi:RNA polymerase sigma factor (sigma-70 family)
VAAPSDADLVRRCLEDDQGAWVALTERYGDLVYGIARRHGLPADVASDVVQDVFVALLASLRRLRRAERLLAWLVRAARRETWRQVRRGRARRRREEHVARGERSREVTPPEDLAGQEMRQAVKQAYAGLGERCRRLLDALFLAQEGVSYDKIAGELGLAIGSIGALRRRCLESLRDELVRLGFPDAPESL